MTATTITLFAGTGVLATDWLLDAKGLSCWGGAV
jgi:hypothetical protein